MNNSIFSCKFSHTILPPLPHFKSDTLHRTNPGTILENKIFCYFFIKFSVALSRTKGALEARAAAKLTQPWVVIPYNYEMTKFSTPTSAETGRLAQGSRFGPDGELFLNLPNPNKFPCVQQTPVV